MIRFFAGSLFMLGVLFCWLHFRYLPQQRALDVELTRCQIMYAREISEGNENVIRLMGVIQ